MTLNTETVALLRYGIDALLHLTGPASYALLTPDERKTALQHLMVTAEAAATFAEVAQGEALALPKLSSSDTERIKVEGDRQEAIGDASGKETEAECLARGRERSIVETRMARAALLQVRKEKVIIEEDIEWMTEKLKKARDDELDMVGSEETDLGEWEAVILDIQIFDRSVKRLEAEKARLEGEEETRFKAIERSVQDTETLRKEMDRQRTETIM